MESPILSIITITLNNQKGLAKTLESIKKQKGAYSIENIIIDGISNYDVNGLVVAVGSKAKLYQEADSGLYDAMNKGLSRSAGQYVLFLNSGDELSHVSILKDVVRTLEIREPDFLYGDSVELSDHMRLLKKARHHRFAWYGMFTHHQSMIYKRDLLAELRYDLSFPLAADYAFTLDFLKKAKSIFYFPHPICIFERGGVSSLNIRQSVIDLYHIRRQRLGYKPITSAAVVFLTTTVFLLRKLMPKLYDRFRFLGLGGNGYI